MRQSDVGSEDCEVTGALQKGAECSGNRESIIEMPLTLDARTYRHGGGRVDNPKSEIGGGGWVGIPNSEFLGGRGSGNS